MSTGTRKAKRCPATFKLPVADYGLPEPQYGFTFDCPECGQLARLTYTGKIAAHVLPLAVTA